MGTLMIYAMWMRIECSWVELAYFIYPSFSSSTFTCFFDKSIYPFHRSEGTFFLVDSDDPKDLSLAGLHGSMDGSAHGGGVFVDRQHPDLPVVLKKCHVASVFFRFDGFSLSGQSITMTSSPSVGN